MTYNIRGGLGLDGHRDTEVHRWLPWSGWVNQAARLKKITGMSFVFQANVRFIFGGYGIGVATHYPIRRVQRHRLPSGRETRGLLEVELATPDGFLTVFCTHWGLSREERSKQAQATATHLRAVGTPLVFCGDLNDISGADYVGSMRKQAHLYDCGVAMDLPTYPADTPIARIDVIYVSPELPLDQLVVLDAKASDHRPVVADFGRSG